MDDIVWRILPYLSRELLSDEPVSSLHLTAMLSLVLSSLAASRRTASTPSLPAHVARMKEIFDTDYAHSHSLAALESSLGVSRYRLCHDFSDCIGVPPIQYLNRVRLKAARTLLRTTTLTIREVSAAVGIENTTHFINLFKKMPESHLCNSGSPLCTNLYFSGFHAVFFNHVSFNNTDSLPIRFSRHFPDQRVNRLSRHLFHVYLISSDCHIAKPRKR